MVNVNSFRAVGRMMEVCGIHSFTVRDLVSPDPKRTRRFLSGIINFLKFREEKLGLLAELTGTREGLNAHLADAKERASVVADRLTRLREQSAEDSRAVAAEETAIKETEIRIADLERQQTMTREETARLKDRNESLKSTLMRQVAELEEAQHTRAALASQVVSNPEAFRARIAEAGAALQADLREGRAAERRARDLQVWIASATEAVAEARLAVEAVSDVRAESERERAAEIELEVKDF